MMKDLLQILSKYSKGRFLEIKDGVPYYLTTGKIIPAHCIRMPERSDWGDGFYSLDKYTCGDRYGCRVGRPSPRCAARGIVNPYQCGKYTVGKIRTHTLSTEQIIHILFDLVKKVHN